MSDKRCVQFRLSKSTYNDFKIVCELEGLKIGQKVEKFMRDFNLEYSEILSKKKKINVIMPKVESGKVGSGKVYSYDQDGEPF